MIWILIKNIYRSLGLCRTWFKPTQPVTRTKTGKQLPLDAYRFFMEKMINLICIMLTRTMLIVLCFWRVSCCSLKSDLCIKNRHQVTFKFQPA
ncbi:hypothetical protein HanIR_Chr01g0030191 [Helianthus annuus]|nr:hypothetical protein HanIR_Chr01g0030191 [Helianthus annuus]